MKVEFLKLVCPECGGRSLGKVGTDQYYCWDCCVEFSWLGPEIEIFEVDPEGTLISLGKKEAREAVRNGN